MSFQIAARQAGVGLVDLRAAKLGVMRRMVVLGRKLSLPIIEDERDRHTGAPGLRGYIGHVNMMFVRTCSSTNSNSDAHRGSLRLAVLAVLHSEVFIGGAAVFMKTPPHLAITAPAHGEAGGAAGAGAPCWALAACCL
jgi:hypothetical protein